MKTNKILLFSLAAAMMAGCADDEYVLNNASSNEGVNGKLVEAGLLGVGMNGGEAETRAYNPVGNFVWMPTALESNGALTAGRNNQKIGLCWTGVDPDGFGAVATADQKVYTNYEYEHVGWLDVNATSPIADPCDAQKLMNGAFIVNEGTPAAKFDNIFKTDGRWNAYYADNTKGLYESTGHEESTGDLNLARGVFKTNNASVFQGEYLAYYPYTSAFTKGQILAHEPTTFEVDLNADRYAAASEAAFSIGYLPKYDGGSASSGISGKTLNGFLIAKLYNESVINSDKVNLKQVIFYSETDGVLYEQDLDAAKCVADLKDGKLDEIDGGLYFNGINNNGTKAISNRTNAIVANLKNSEFAAKTFVNETDKKWVALPVLPQTINDLKVILINDQDQSCTIDLGQTTISSNKAVIEEINLNTCVFKNEYLAVDESSFLSAMSKIKTNGSIAKGFDANQVKLLKDIRLTMTDKEYVGLDKYAGIYNSLFFDKNINIYSACGAKLIIASDTYVNIKNLNTTVTDGETPKLTIDVPVVVEGAGCCGDYVGKLSVGGTQNANKVCTVIFNKDIENYGTLAFGNNGNGNTNISVNAKITNKLDEFAATRQKNADAAQMYILGGNFKGENTIAIKAVENEGAINVWRHSIDVYKDKVEFDYTHGTKRNDVDTKRVTETTIETLVNKGTVEVGKNMLVNVTKSLDNQIETALIKMVGEGKSQVDGKLDVTASTAANKGTIDNTGVVNFTRTSLLNTGLFIDRTNGQIGGYRVNNGTTAAGTEVVKKYATDEEVVYTTDLGVAGIYVAQVETVDRMRKVLGDAVLYPSTVIVEVLDCDKSFFNLNDFKNDLTGKDVRINPTVEKQITFKAFDADKKLVAKNFGHCVEVWKGTLLLKDGLLSAEKDVKVLKSAKALKTAQRSADIVEGQTTVTVGRDLITEANVNHDYNLLLTVERNLNVNGETFTSNGTFVVAETVTVAKDATFDSNGDKNTAGAFTTSGITTFAKNTTTEIAGEFACPAGTFEREGLDIATEYRATVNVGSLGELNGTTSTAWPTVR